ncbi:Reticulon-like protein B5 [Acorus gramineus]|uniref:Reticulon-like protein n=1 Tax=Acorus gramineus TaxID=55184 RepID=A0AAV9BI80_ACOGR|nr:Reticulon-like protein B5 [Acorus gramineus]
MRRRTEEKIRSLFRVIVQRDWLALAELIVGLWVLSFIGSWFDLLTLLYIGLLLCLTCPVIYHKYKNQINRCVERVKAESKRWCVVVDEKVFKRVKAMVDEKVLKKIKRKDEEVKVKKTE